MKSKYGDTTWFRALRRLLRGYIIPYVEAGMTSAPEVGRNAAADIKRAVEAGDREAAMITDLGLVELATHESAAVLRERASVNLSWAGQELTVPAMLSIHKLDAAGRPTEDRQHMLWITLDEAALMRLRRETDSKASSLAALVTAFDWAILLMRQTGAPNFVEACRVRGLDPFDAAL